MAKSEPFSMRLSPALDAFVADEARRTRRSKGAVVEVLATEALKQRMFPGVAFRGVDWERRAWIVGTALDVWQIVEGLRDFGSIDRMARESDVGEREIRLAAAYAETFPGEIDERIQENREPIERLRARFPGFDVVATTPAE